MAIGKTALGHPLAVLSLNLFAVVGVSTMVVTAQAPPPPPQQQLPPTTTTARYNVSAVLTVALVAVFVVVFLWVLLNKWRAGAGVRQGPSVVGRRRVPRGLDPAAMAALPVVPYSEIRKHKSAGELECAVCLTAFVDGDEVRLLPQCSHAFHPDCIDPWLQGHVTCPLCRANLEKPAPPPAVALPSPPEVRVDVGGDGEEEEEEAVELERLRRARRAARMPRSRSMRRSLSTAGEVGGHERFTLRLPPHVREEVLKSRWLRHASSLVVRLGGLSCEGTSTCPEDAGGGVTCARRRWASFLDRTASITRGSHKRTAVR
ncbi:hypothetical protein ACP70R_026786 [Stipagrostis hirtigluma subsp. patula]